MTVRDIARIPGADPDAVEASIKGVLDAQVRRWGAPLLNHLLYARRPTIFRGARAMWTGLEASGLIDAGLRALVNRRVAALNGCEF
jgi:alkylhydroperoxidase family enzyme